jgi:predicted nucleic acid-binding protein
VSKRGTPNLSSSGNLVVDSSVAFAWCLPDEDVSELEGVERQVAEYGAVAAAHWPLEVANGLVFAVRRGRIDADFRDSALRDLASLPIVLDAETSAQAWGEMLVLADAHKLTIYDAAYLELAIRRGLPLATLDRALANAARAEGVPLAGSRSA